MRIFLFCLIAALPLWSAPPENALQEAAKAYAAGDTATAIRLYRAFLKEYPDAAEIRSNLGAALVGDGQIAAAVTEYQTALRQLPNNPRVRMNLALAYYKLGRFPEAVQELTVLRQLQPEEPKPALLLGDCLMQMGETQKAVDVLTALQAEYPDDRAAIYLLGTALLKQNKTAQAQAILEKIMRGGESAESAYLQGQSEYLQKNLMAAMGHLARAVELNPQLPGAHSLYGRVLRDVGKGDEGTAQFYEELKWNPYDFTGNIEVAMMLKQDGKLDESLTHLSKALQVRPGDPGALFQRALIHSSQGQLDLARQELERLVKEYPNFSEAHAALATVYYKLKRPVDGDKERAAAKRAQEQETKGPTGGGKSVTPMKPTIPKSATK